MSDKVDNNELTGLLEEADMVENNKVYTHILEKPIVFEGNEYKKLVFDWYKLSGKDLINISKELSAKGKVILQRQFDDDFLLLTAAKACTSKIGTDFLEQLPFLDLMKILDRAKFFTLKSV